MPSDFTTDDDTQLAFAIMDAQDALAEAGIENPHIGAIQEWLASHGIETNIVKRPDGVSVIYRKV